MRASITNLTKTVGVSMRTEPATILKAGLTTPGSPLDPPVESWDDPAVVATTVGSVQPASATAQEAFGVTFNSDRVVIFLDPVTEPVVPVTNRVSIAGRVFSVVQSRSWLSHVEVLGEEVGA